MFSTLTAAGATATLEALDAGASDYVTKPSNTGSFEKSTLMVREQLIPRIHALCARKLRRPAGPGAPAGGRPPVRPGSPPPSRPGAPGLPVRGARPAAPAPGRGAPGRGAPVPVVGPSAGDARKSPRGATIEIVAIGSSTGGPDALGRVVKGLPADFGAPVVVAQHMPPVFTKMFADRLDRITKLTVVEAESGMPLVAGTVYIAPGDHHLEVVRRAGAAHTKLHDGPLENSCRPAVDPLFRSVAAGYAKAAVAVVLTGMGQDGRKGCEVLHRAGIEILVQDEETSVVWGMPGSVAQAGLADAVLPIDAIAQALYDRVGSTRQPRMAVGR
jgi:two-component system chemotaxis response regulator CheB